MAVSERTADAEMHTIPLLAVRQIDTDRPHLTPNIDPMANLIYAAQGADVVLTMVDGRILYENGAYLTLDRERILFDARKAARRLL